MYDEGCNILSAIMQHENISLEAAVGRASELHKADMDRLLYLFKNLPMFPDEVKKELQQYLTDCVLSWVRGNACWSFAAGRYFGDNGLEIEVTARCAVEIRTLGSLSWRSNNGIVQHLLDEPPCLLFCLDYHLRTAFMYYKNSLIR